MCPGENRERITKILIRGLRQLAFEKLGLGVLDIHHIDAGTAARLAADGWLVSQEVHSFWTNAAYPTIRPISIHYRTGNAT